MGTVAIILRGRKSWTFLLAYFFVAFITTTFLGFRFNLFAKRWSKTFSLCCT